jgi:hypothetical protein
VWAAVQVSVDGVTWDTIARVPAANGWSPLEIDLTTHAGRVVYVRFMYDASAASVAADSVWWLRNPTVRVSK